MVLQTGDTVPNFEFTDQRGEIRQFHNIGGKKIVFFFPRVFTAGCTAQACSLRDSYEDLKQEGVSEIFGISLDPADKQQKFKSKFGLKYILVDDPNQTISKAFGVAEKKFYLFSYADRYTFIINDDNTIEQVLENGVSGRKSKYGLDNHGKEVMEFLKI